MTKTRKVKDNTFVAIQAFMVNDLELKGNELFIYAIIYGFCQDEESCFSGSLSYLCAWTNSSKQGVLNSLAKLMERNLITKKEIYKDNVKYCEYHTTKLTGVVNKVDQGCSTNLTGGGQLSLPNNIIHNITNNIINNDVAEEKEETTPIKSEREIELEKSFDEALANSPSSPIENCDNTKRNVSVTKGSTKKRTKKNCVRAAEQLEDDEFYKPVYEAYRSAFFSLYDKGTIPNCGKYKSFVDDCLKRYRELELSNIQIRDLIVTAINNAKSDKFIVQKRFPIAMILSESVMPRLVDTVKTTDDPKVGVDFNSQNYGV